MNDNVVKFFQKRYRERLLYELTSKKRDEFFKKIAHTAEKYIDLRLIAEKSDRPLPAEKLARFFRGDCFVIAYHSALDGTVTDFETAISELWSCGVPYLIYAGDHLYLETEYDFSVHAAYLLKLTKGAADDQ